MKAERGIVPRKIRGFRDIDPRLNSLKWHIIKTVSQVYQLYGFEHWDTPVLEYADSLGKYMPDTDTIEQGIYSFRNPAKEAVLKADGSKLYDASDSVVMENQFVALRYDLTAPLARHYAEKLWTKSLKGELNSQNAPLFRRFQYGPVYRYEAKLDPGRFREFWQLDFDTVGTESVATDAEVCMILADALEAIGLKRTTYLVKVNNRKILKGLLQNIGLTTEQAEQDILRVVDKFDKIGMAGVKAELGKQRRDESGAIIRGLGLESTKIEAIISFLEAFDNSSARKSILSKLKQLLKDSSIGVEGINELELIDEILTQLEYDEQRVIFDPTLVRGMAYYTGPVFEVESRQSYTDSKGNVRKVGSICGGGRYDGLVEKLNGIRVPATGASLGIDRLAELLILTKQVETQILGPVFIVVFDQNLLPQYQKIAQELRAQKIETEIYYGTQKSLRKQLTYADRKNAPFAIMLGEDELKRGVVSVKDLELGRRESQIKDRTEWRKKVQKEIPRTDLTSYIVDQLKNKQNG